MIHILGILCSPRRVKQVNGKSVMKTKYLTHNENSKVGLEIQFSTTVFACHLQSSMLKALGLVPWTIGKNKTKSSKTKNNQPFNAARLNSLILKRTIMLALNFRLPSPTNTLYRWCWMIYLIMQLLPETDISIFWSLLGIILCYTK